MEVAGGDQAQRRVHETYTGVPQRWKDLPGLLHQVRTRALWLDCGQTTAEGNLDKVLAMIGKSRSSSLPGRKFTRKLEFFSQPCVFV